MVRKSVISAVANSVPFGTNIHASISPGVYEHDVKPVLAVLAMQLKAFNTVLLM